MPDMFDYLKWRGDIPFSQMPLNPVDGLILSTLSYIGFENIVSEEAQPVITLSKAAEAFLSLPDHSNRIRIRTDLDLLKAAVQAPRFQEVGMVFYRDELIPEEESQFAAMTFLLGDGSAFLAFRGTDNTLIGWKEDFNMSFQQTIPAQRKAVQYTHDVAIALPYPLWLGGHSKGGNLAVFAAAKADPIIQKRILRVFNNDGPGFTEYLMGDPGYRAMVPKIQTYIPESSVIGMLLEHQEPYTVVKSRQVSIMQHEPSSWEVLGAGFITTEEVTENSQLLNQTIKTWLAGMSKEDRNAFVDTVFDLLGTGGIETATDIFHPRNVRTYFRILGEDEELRRRLSGELAGLVRSAKAILAQRDG